MTHSPVSETLYITSYPGVLLDHMQGREHYSLVFKDGEIAVNLIKVHFV